MSSALAYPNRATVHSPTPQSLDGMPYWGVHDQKQPFTPRTGRPAKSNDRRTFGTRAEADQAFASGRYDGLGVLVEESLRVTGMDLDHVVPEDRAYDEAAIPANVWRVIRMSGTAWWWSYSGTGLRGFFAASTGQDYKNKTDKDNWIAAEQYTRLRFVTVTPDRKISGTPDTFSTEVDDLVAVLEALDFPLRAAESPPQPKPAYVGGNLNLDDLLAKAFNAKNGDKVRRLYEGDIGDYPESQGDPGFSSEADLALAGYLGFWTQDDGLVADAMRSSKLYRKKLDRQDYIDRTIQRVRTNQTAWWDPDYMSRAPLPMIMPPIAVGATCDQKLAIALETIRLQGEDLTTARDTIARQAARLDAYSVTATTVERIVTSNQIEAGPKLTAVALAMEEGEQQKRGKPAAELGRHIPGSWIAKRAGVSVNTANKHLKRLADAGLITRNVVAERVVEDMVDDDTGEIIPRGKTISRSYYPDQASELIAKFTSYQRPDDAPKHGGKRDLRCKNHPDSPTTTMHITTCDACGTVLDEQATHHTPAEWKHHLDVSTIVASSKGDTKMVFALQHPVDTKMVFAPQPPAMPPPGDYSDDAPPDDWALPHPGSPGLDWWTR